MNTSPLRRVGLVILFLFSLPAFAFERPATGEAKLLVGTWAYLDPGEIGYCKITYGDDGAFAGTYQLKQGSLLTFGGKWSFKDGKIYHTYTRSNVPGVTGTSGYDNLVEMTEKTRTVIEGKGGARKVYRRLLEQ